MKKKQVFTWDKLSLGVCYYPEHWDQKLWREDLKRMAGAGIETIRIGEFAWSIIEPEEGKFTFAFWDAFMELIQETNLKVIWGTPTATPPAWLTRNYPEVLNCQKDGTPYSHGARRHYTYNSPIYQKYVKRIVEQIARHYGQHPSIIGWQVDNELNCGVAEFYSKSDTRAFRRFLQNKYRSLPELNQAWGTVFWNQTYTAWEEITVPEPTPQDAYNPHRMLDYYRFISDSAIQFCQMQSDCIRQFCKESDFITTNGMFRNIDNHRMERECLDVYTYDSYPNFAFAIQNDSIHATNLNDRKTSKHLAEVRSLCPHFGIMEQQSGANGWCCSTQAPMPRPGQIMLWAMQSIAHGADYVSFFRWRTCTVGTEMYWHGILQYDNRDNRILNEVKELGLRLTKMQPIVNAQYRAVFAIVKDYDNQWDAQADQWHNSVEKISEQAIFQAGQLLHAPMDFIYMEEETDIDELLQYTVLFYPHPTIITRERVTLLRKYAEQGGCLILGCRSGYKDIHGQCVMQPMPGELAELAGVQVEEFTYASPMEEPVYADWEGTKLSMGLFHDILEPMEGTKVLATYTGSYYCGKPALTEHAYGAGKVLYFGGTFDEIGAKEFLHYTGAAEPFGEIMTLPSCCELAIREKEGKTYCIILNYQKDSCKANLHQSLQDLETGRWEIGEIGIPPYGVRIFAVAMEDRNCV